jgi:probable HAF family extracellular repeat protein
LSENIELIENNSKLFVVFGMNWLWGRQSVSTFPLGVSKMLETSFSVNGASPLLASNSLVYPESFGALSLEPHSASNSRHTAPIYGTAADDLIEVTLGNNTVFVGDGQNTVLSGRGNDLIYTGLGNDIIDAGDGRNTIFAGEGTNLVTTGMGNDLITTGLGNDFIDAGDGRNTIFAGEGTNRILTGKGKDIITTGDGNDTIYSGAGGDTINAGGGINIISAGIGEDTVILSGGLNKLILNGGSGSVTVLGFNVTTDKLRLGASLLGKSLTFVTKGADTLVKSGNDLLATLKGISSGSQALVDSGPLYRYVATDLGSLSTNVNGSVNASSINDFGQIAGRYDTGATFTNTNATTGVVNPNNLVRSGFVWNNGVQTALTSTGVKSGQSNAGGLDGETVTLLTPNVNTIGNRGQILGTGDEVRQPNPLPTDRGLVWTLNSSGGYDLVINDFGGDESYFFDTNNRNQVPGRNIIGDYDAAVYFENGVKIDLPDLGGNGGTARGINAKGQIVGYVDSDGILDATSTNTAAIWEKDANGVYQLTTLGTFGEAQATLRDINNVGQIIGSSTNGLSGTAATSTPFVYQNGQYSAIGSLGGNTGSTNGINEFGDVVGSSQIANGTNHGYVYIGGQLTDLNDLVTIPLTYNGAVVTLTSAVSINNFGEIVATGIYTYVNSAGVNTTGTRSYRLQIA